jgi:hypothetical protein
MNPIPLWFVSFAKSYPKPDLAKFSNSQQKSKGFGRGERGMCLAIALIPQPLLPKGEGEPD